jgi:tetratricopeptide (TPR) repeat protein
MRWWLLLVFLVGLPLLAQSAGNGNSAPSAPGAQSQDASKPQSKPSSLEPPRSDRVDAEALGERDGESSSKDTQIDLSPPPGDAKTHPLSSDATPDADVGEFHPWNPHKAAKDVEVGDFYFKRKNYRAAEDRYREALYYKDSDAVATFHLAVCLDKMNRPEEARKLYEAYLKLLPNGPEAGTSRKALDRLKTVASATPDAK